MNRASNFYQIEGHKYDRVTRITGMIPKQDILTNWAAKITAEAAADVPQSEYQTKSIYIDAVKKESYARRTENRDRGTEIHGAIEAHLLGEEFLSKYHGWVKQAELAIEDLGIDMRFHDTETVLVNKDLNYAGTCDLHGPTVVDWKSGKRIYPDYLIQMWAYLEATHWYNPDTDTLEEIETKPDVAHIVRVSETDFEVATLRRDTQLYDLCEDTFLALQRVRAWNLVERNLL